jgi:hypothetical protein
MGARMKRVVLLGTLSGLMLAALAVVVVSGGGVNQYRAYQASDLGREHEGTRASTRLRHFDFTQIPRSPGA